jgi:hypothetical protein
MKKLLILFSLFVSSLALAQSTVVSGPIIDQFGNTWSFGTVTAVFQRAPNTSTPPVWSGGPLIPNPPTVNTDAGGNFTISLPSTNAITPSGGTWIFSVCPNASLQCAVLATPLLGGTQNLNTLLLGANVFPAATVPPTQISKVYNTNETFTPPLNQGGMLYNTTTQQLLVFTSTGWQPFASVGGLPVITNPLGNQTITQPSGSSFNIITSGSGSSNITGPLYATNFVSQLTPSIDIASKAYAGGAQCNGGDDSAAIQAATNMAGVIYAAFHTPTNILVTKGVSGTGNCIINTGIIYQSGSHFVGSGGTINIPNPITGFSSGGSAGLAVGDVSDVEFDDLIINQTTSGSLPVISYTGGTGNSGGGVVTPQRHFHVKNTVIHGGGFGVVVGVFNQNDGRSHHLSDVQLIGNYVYADLVPLASTTATAGSGVSTIVVASNTGITIGQSITAVGINSSAVVTSIAGTSIGISAPTTATLSATPITFSGVDQAARDGLHINGDISDFHMDDNVVTDRGDAALALTSIGSSVFSTFPAGLLATLTPTNGTISNNTCTNDGSGVDFSGGNNVTAAGNTCVNSIQSANESPALRFIFDQFPTPQNINVIGGRYANASTGADTTVLKVDFSGAQVTQGVIPNCFCTISGADFNSTAPSPSIFLLANNITLQHNVFEAPIQNISIQSINGFQVTGITIRDSTWLTTTRTISTVAVGGSLVNSSFINDDFLGNISTFPVVPTGNTFSTPSPIQSLCGNAQLTVNDGTDCAATQLTYGSGANPTVTIATTHSGSPGPHVYTWDGPININGTTTINSWTVFQLTITPASVPAASCTDQSFSATGLQTTDQLTQLRPPSTLGNVSATPLPSGANNLVIHFCNVSAAAVTPPSGMYQFGAIH